MSQFRNIFKNLKDEFCDTSTIYPSYFLKLVHLQYTHFIEHNSLDGRSRFEGLVNDTLGGNKKNKKVISTGASRAVPHLGTNPA